MPAAKKEPLELQLERFRKLYLKDAPWALRITERSDRPAPYLEIKTRLWEKNKKRAAGEEPVLQPVMRECGCIYGDKARRVLDVIRKIISNKRTPDDDLPMELERIIVKGQLVVKGKTLPLDEEAGVKLALLFKVQEKLKDPDRVEIAAWRIARFSREEAQYWYSRATTFSKTLNNWALSGMRVMLCGGSRAKKGEVKNTLEELRYEQ